MTGEADLSPGETASQHAAILWIASTLMPVSAARRCATAPLSRFAISRLASISIGAAEVADCCGWFALPRFELDARARLVRRFRQFLQIRNAGLQPAGTVSYATAATDELVRDERA